MKRLCFAAALIGLGLFFGACTSTRSLEAVERSGDKAMERGDYQTAQKDYKEYVDRRPGKARVQNSLGKAYIALGDPQSAAQCFSVAHDLDPANEEYITSMADALYATGDRGRLYEFLRRLTVQPGRASDYDRLATYAIKLGDADEAQTALLTAARIDGGTTVGPQLALAKFYSGIGQKDKALNRLRMALYVDPKNPEVAARIRELGEIPGPSFAIPPEEIRQAGVPADGK